MCRDWPKQAHIRLADPTDNGDTRTYGSAGELAISTMPMEKCPQAELLKLKNAHAYFTYFESYATCYVD